MGHHKVKIKKGVFGEYSKVREEFEELTDAVEQKNKILIICELADLVGAIEEYTKSFNLTVKDLREFSNLNNKQNKN